LTVQAEVGGHMLKTIILLTATVHQQRALGQLLKTHNPALSFRFARTLDDLAVIEPHVLHDARLIAFTTGVIVPQGFLEALGHGAYNFGSDAILVQLRLFCADQSGLQQIEFPATVHLTSD
jgi:hypothetical protein